MPSSARHQLAARLIGFLQRKAISARSTSKSRMEADLDYCNRGQGFAAPLVALFQAEDRLGGYPPDIRYRYTDQHHPTYALRGFHLRLHAWSFTMPCSDEWLLEKRWFSLGNGYRYPRQAEASTRTILTYDLLLF